MSNAMPLDDEEFLDDDQLQMCLTSYRRTPDEGRSRESYTNQDQDFSQIECHSNLQCESRCESRECYTEKTELMYANEDLKARLEVAEENARQLTKLVARLTKELQHCQTKMQKFQDMLSGHNKEKADLQYTINDLRIKLKSAEEKANQYTTAIKSTERSSPAKNVALSSLKMKPQSVKLKPDLEPSMDDLISWKPQNSSGPQVTGCNAPKSTTNDFSMNQQWKMDGAEIQKPKTELSEKEAPFKTAIKSTERSSPAKSVALADLNMKPQRVTWKPDLEASINSSWNQHASGSKVSDWNGPKFTTIDVTMNPQWIMQGAKIEKPKTEPSEMEVQFKELTVNCKDAGCKDFMRAYITAINSDSKERHRKLSAFYPAVISELIIDNRKYKGRESIIDAWQKFWSQGHEVVMRSFVNKRQDNGRTLIVTVIGDLFQDGEFITKYRQTLCISKTPHHAGQIKNEIFEYIEEEKDGT